MEKSFKARIDSAKDRATLLAGEVFSKPE